jgi:hypothetical protein
MDNDAPTIQEITRLTRHELTTASKSDDIRECGRAALALLPNDPDTCLKLAYQKLHDVPYKEVKKCWRRLYTDASLWKVVGLVEAHAKCREDDGREEKTENNTNWVDEVVRLLDMALILAGAPGREEVVELWFSALKAMLHTPTPTYTRTHSAVQDRSVKRRKLSPDSQAPSLPEHFPITLPNPTPTLRCPILRVQELNLEAFQTRVSDTATHTPLVIQGAIQHWPALDERPWRSSGYLLEKSLGGRRLVPVEIGKSYTDKGWGQKIITFREFMETYMLDQDFDKHTDGTEGSGTRQTGYLAQHDLFAQIPSLRSDISIPDYCYSTPAPSPHLTHIKPTAQLDEPLLNAWFGPARTISPLHTDPYHNILAQVVGYKYVRLYAPGETEKLYPRGQEDGGVDMSNTSEVDMDEGMAVYPDISCWDIKDVDGDAAVLEKRRRQFEDQFPKFKEAKYVEGILGPGECLYIPVGWWHYIRSLTVSFSVSFWFN